MADQKPQGFSSPTLLANPFSILGATPKNTRGEIAELADPQALLVDEVKVADARKTLLHPRLRLAAEVGWLPEVNDETIRDVLSRRFLASESVSSFNLPPLAEANVFSWLIEKKTATGAEGRWISGDLPLLIDAMDRIDQSDVEEDVDGDRAISGFPETVSQQVEEARRDQRRYLLRTATTALRLQELPTRADSLATISTRIHFSNSLDDLVDTYELDACQEIQELGQSILDLTRDIESKTLISEDRILQTRHHLHDYGRLIRPILMNHSERGLEHVSTDNIVDEVNKLAMDSANHHAPTDQRIALLTSLLEIVNPIAEMKIQLEWNISYWERVKQTSSPVPASSTAIGRSAQTSSGQPTFQPQSVPASPVSPSRSGGSKLFRWIAAIVILFGIGSAVDKFNGDDTSAESARSTTVVNPCIGIDSWWNGTQARIRQSNSIISSLTYSSSYYDYQFGQQQITEIARQQRYSKPPPVAVSLNTAEADLLDFIAQDLTDTTSSEFTSNQTFSRLSHDVDVESHAVANICNFTITGG